MDGKEAAGGPTDTDEVRQKIFPTVAEGRSAQPNLNIQQNSLMAPEGEADLFTLERLMLNMLENGRCRVQTLMQLVENLFLNPAQAPAPTHPVQSPEVPSYHIMPALSRSIKKFEGELDTYSDLISSKLF